MATRAPRVQARLAALGEGHSGGVWAVCPVRLGDGRLAVASGSSDLTVRVHDAVTGELVATCRGHRDFVWRLCTVRVGKRERLMSVSWDQYVSVWDPQTGKLLTRCKAPAPLYSVSAGRLENGRAVIATGDRAGRVTVRDARTLALVASCAGHRNSVWGLSAIKLAKGSLAFCSASDDGTVRMWDAATGRQLWCAGGKRRRLSLPFKRGRSGSRGGGHTDEVTCVRAVARADGGDPVVVSGSRDRTVKVWDAASGQLLATCEGHQAEITAVTSVRLKSGRCCLASSDASGIVCVFDAATGEQLTSTLEGSGPAMALDALALPDGGRCALAVGHEDGTINLVCPETGARMERCEGHGGEIRSLRALGAHDGKALLACGAQDSIVSVWQAELLA